MVIIDSKSGQLANRIFSFAFFIANSVEYRYTLYNPSFDEYEKYFSLIKDNDFGDIPIRIRLSNNEKWNQFLIKNLNRLRYHVPKIDKRGYFLEELHIKEYDKENIQYDLNQEEFLSKTKKKLLFVNGWNFRDHRNFIKHSAVIRKVFTPLPQYQENVERLIAPLKEKYDTLIGVHIRRGDYKDFLDGRYYFDWKQYADWLKSLSHQLEGKNVCFLLCSNEKIPETAFSEVNTSLSTGHFIEDMYALSACDYILGAPSTYSMWASFYGKTSLYIVKNKEDEPTIKEFSTIVSLDRFEDGRVFTH